CESGKNRERENRKDNRKDYEMKMTDALVMTSGNVSGAPIARTDEDAVRELGGFCDLILSHDREIRIRADDSVADWYDGAPYLIRRSRGYAPLPVMLREGEGQAQRWRGAVLAAGGELKNTFCVAKNQLFYPSPYVGDMGDLRTVEALRETAARLCDLLETRPDVIACDLHPAYNTTALAEEIARRQGAGLFPVQHHFAHILSCMAENGVAAGEEVIGAAMDGTGYGADGTIWGGEFLRAGYGGYERLGCIRPFPQVGGDAAAREGWRVAVSMLGELFGDGKSGAKQDEQEVLHITGALGLCSAAQAQTIWRMARSGINTVRSTSAGRLFDAVSAILGIRLSSTYEGEAACFLQFAAQRYERENPRQAAQIARESRGQESGCFEADGAAAQEVRAGGADRYPEQESRGAEDLFTLGTGGIVRRMTEGRLAGEDTGELAYRFHCLFAEQIAEGCLRCAKQTGLSVCALSGGVFQNTLLLMKTEAALTRAGLRVLRHHLIPANDGGIALGQAAAAMYAQSGQKSGVLY
ncbi:MAG: Sua5/YciO/YrdC/YwlC family protein, partial [Eubacteriales bacterium]|nr:Sua5/YciO/YrdC/YwlC family protein [Eubacteriales bacterium]